MTLLGLIGIGLAALVVISLIIAYAPAIMKIVGIILLIVGVIILIAFANSIVIIPTETTASMATLF